LADIVQRVQLKVIEVVIQGCDALGESVGVLSQSPDRLAPSFELVDRIARPEADEEVRLIAVMQESGAPFRKVLTQPITERNPRLCESVLTAFLHGPYRVS